MKTIKEGNIREALKARVIAYGGEIRAVSWLGRNNAPDVLCLFPFGSRYGDQINDRPEMMHPFIETKRPGKAATEAQAREHERMRAAGCVVLVITTIQELDAWLSPSVIEDDGPEEFQWLLYCYHCGRRLNEPADMSTEEVAPQICAKCAGVWE